MGIFGWGKMGIFRRKGDFGWEIGDFKRKHWNFGAKNLNFWEGKNGNFGEKKNFGGKN